MKTKQRKEEASMGRLPSSDDQDSAIQVCTWNVNPVSEDVLGKTEVVRKHLSGLAPIRRTPLLSMSACIKTNVDK